MSHFFTAFCVSYIFLAAIPLSFIFFSKGLTGYAGAVVLAAGLTSTFCVAGGFTVGAWTNAGFFSTCGTATLGATSSRISSSFDVSIV